jgi:transposase InsO family protein
LLQEASGQAHALAEAARLSTRPEHEDYLPRRCATGRSGSARQELRSGRAGQALGGPDITYVRSREGFLYLAFILYVCSRKVVGWSMATHLRTELVADALGMAIVRRKPSLGLVHHSDRGVQGGFNRWSQHRGLSAMLAGY